MKVLLVYPAPPRTHWPRGIFRSHWVPTGLLSLSSGLRRAGHEVRIVHREGQLVSNGFDWAGADSYLKSLMQDFRPEMVGISVTTPLIPEAELIAGWAKAICGPQVIVVVGGPHASALPDRTLADCSAIDAVGVGESEETIVEVADNGLSRNTRGLVLRRDGGIVRTPARRPVKDLDTLGLPDYEPFDMAFHLKANRWLVRWLEEPGMNLRTSRGCPNRCSFCAGHAVSGSGVRYHSVEYVMENLGEAAGRLGARMISFEDETLAFDRDRVLELCEQMKRRGFDRRVSWQCCMRVDQVDAEILKALKSAGCIQIEYGFESGSDEILRRIVKNATVEMNRRAVRMTHEVGIRIFANVMFGLPGERAEDFRATVKFLQWARPQIFHFGCMLPFPGTDIYESLPEDTRNSLDWREFTYADQPLETVNLTAMSKEQFRRLYDDFYKYFASPATTLSLLRDTAPEDREVRSTLQRRLKRFARKHPIRASRLPWRSGRIR